MRAERRQLTPAQEAAQADRLTKRIVVYTLSGVLWVLILTTCYLAVRQMEIPDVLKDFTLYILGVLSGCLIKMGVDHVMDKVPVVNAPGDKLEVTEVAAPDDKGQGGSS